MFSVKCLAFLSSRATAEPVGSLRSASRAAAGPSGRPVCRSPGWEALVGDAWRPHTRACSSSPSTRAVSFGSGAGGWNRVKELVWAYKKLSKFRLSAFVVSTACAGYVLGSGEQVGWRGLGWTALGTMGASACANTLNQIYEVNNDAMMARTRARPLPAGRLSRLHALAFAIVVGGGGLAILSTQTNPMTTALGAGNIALYAGVYTPLKQVTPLNTWVGAVVGAIPPLMGWSASAGQLEPGAWILAAALYFWQIPHFLSLAYLCKEDYAQAGFKMLSKYDPFGRRLASISLRNCLYMFPLGILSVICGVTTSAFGYEAGALSVGLALSTTVFHQKPSKSLARAAFKASLVFLPLFMLGMLFHRKPNTHEIEWPDVKDRLLACLFPGSGKDVDKESDGRLGSMQLAPFPFVTVPTAAVVENQLIWEDLDEAIAEQELEILQESKASKSA